MLSRDSTGPWGIILVWRVRVQALHLLLALPSHTTAAELKPTLIYIHSCRAAGLPFTMFLDSAVFGDANLRTAEPAKSVVAERLPRPWPKLQVACGNTLRDASKTKRIHDAYLDIIGFRSCGSCQLPQEKGSCQAFKGVGMHLHGLQSFGN